MSDRRPTPLAGTPIIQARARAEVSPPPPLPEEPAAAIAVIGDRMASMERRLGDGARTFEALAEALANQGREFAEALRAVERSAGSSLEKAEERLLAALQSMRADVAQDFAGYAKTIDEIKTSVAALSPKRLELGKLALAWAPIAILLAGFVWAAARYPERDEFRALEREVVQLRSDLRVLTLTAGSAGAAAARQAP